MLAVILAVACAPTADAPPPAAAPTAGRGAASPSPALTALPSPTPPAPSPSPSPAPSPVVTRGAFDLARALSVVTALADDIGSRAAGTEGDIAARAYVADALRAAGWSVREEPVPLPQGGTTANIVARQPGASLGRPHLVVGAHLDTVAGTPGANDNATGVGVLVALAEELADEPLREPVVLVAFGAEEYQPGQPRRHHLGSQAYADLRAPQVTGMVGVDMVGNGSPTCLCWLRGADPAIAQQLAAVADAEGLAVRAEARGDISDHGPFALAGVPAVLLWTYDDGVLHTPADTTDRIRPDDLERTGRLVLAWLRAR